MDHKRDGTLVINHIYLFKIIDININLLSIISSEARRLLVGLRARDI